MQDSQAGNLDADVGVLAEVADGERRVALVPEGARRLVRAGMSVLVETGAGTGAWYSDEEYTGAGAGIVSREAVFSRSRVIVSLAGPPRDQAHHLRAGQLVIGVLGTAGSQEAWSDLASRRVTALSLDRIPRTMSRAQSMDVLTSQAGVAGYKAVLVAAGAFGRYFPLLITAAGTSRPARVLVLGAGVAGLSAIGTARRLGAVVSGYDVRPETRGEIESLGAKFLELSSVAGAAGVGGYARALTPEEQGAQQRELESLLPSFDVIITTAAVPGRRPPLLVSEGAIAQMRAGTVLVDMGSGPLGGNVAGTEPDTTVVTGNGVMLIGAGNLASTVPTAASDAFSQNIVSVLGAIFKEGSAAADLDDEVIRAMLVTHDGDVVVHPGPPTDEPARPSVPGPDSSAPPGDQAGGTGEAGTVHRYEGAR